MNPGKDPSRKRESGMRKEYDFSGGVRGKHAARFPGGSRVVVLEPDVAKVFRDSKAVNEALRVLAALARRQARIPKR
jgi:hypothetical protein